MVVRRVDWALDEGWGSNNWGGYNRLDISGGSVGLYNWGLDNYWGGMSYNWDGFGINLLKKIVIN